MVEPSAFNCDSKLKLLTVALMANEFISILKSQAVQPTFSSHFRKVFCLPGSLSSQWLQHHGVWNFSPNALGLSFHPTPHEVRESLKPGHAEQRPQK